MNHKGLTYGQLEYLLTELGYHLGGQEEGGRIWIDPQYDALKWLPAAPPDEQARIHHLMTVHKVSVEKGIVAEERFQELLIDESDKGRIIRFLFAGGMNSALSACGGVSSRTRCPLQPDGVRQDARRSPERGIHSARKGERDGRRAKGTRNCSAA